MKAVVARLRRYRKRSSDTAERSFPTSPAQLGVDCQVEKPTIAQASFSVEKKRIACQPFRFDRPY